MKKLRFLFAAFLLPIGLLVGVLQAHANGNNCSFQSKGLSMSFGVLNPASGSDVLVAVTGTSKAGDCAPGQTMTISGDNGLNYNGTRNLKSTAGGLIPYSLASLPQSRAGPGNGTYVAFTFNGSILWSDYANASAGGYSDTVIISVTP
ncbi:MAG: spore coat protein U domain-containing protein [Pseudomonadota bacterium]